MTVRSLRRGADKSLAFPISYLQHNQNNFSWMGLRNLNNEVISVWSSGGIRSVNIFFNPVVYCFLYKAKDLSALFHIFCPEYSCASDSNHLCKQNLLMLVFVIKEQCTILCNRK
jgi:hypothetical protein